MAATRLRSMRPARPGTAASMVSSWSRMRVRSAIRSVQMVGNTGWSNPNPFRRESRCVGWITTNPREAQNAVRGAYPSRFHPLPWENTTTGRFVPVAGAETPHLQRDRSFGRGQLDGGDRDDRSAGRVMLSDALTSQQAAGSAPGSVEAVEVAQMLLPPSGAEPPPSHPLRGRRRKNLEEDPGLAVDPAAGCSSSL